MSALWPARRDELSLRPPPPRSLPPGSPFWAPTTASIVGQVGLGGRGTDHINFYSSLDSDCRIVAICDVNQAARERAVALVKKLQGHHAQRIRRHARDVRVQGRRRRLHHHAESLARAGGHLGLPGGQGCLRRKAGLPQHLRRRSQMVAAARKYKRMVQVGSQSRSIAHKMKAIELLQRGRDRAGLSRARALLPAALLHRPHAGRAGARRPGLGPLPRARRRCSRTARTNSPTTGTGSGTPATATSATRACMKWISACGAWAAAAGPSRSRPAAASSSGRTTRRRPTRSRPPSTSAMRR